MIVFMRYYSEGQKKVDFGELSRAVIASPESFRDDINPLGNTC